MSADVKRPCAQRLSRNEEHGTAWGHTKVHRALLASGIFAKTDHETASVLSKQLAPIRLPRGCTVGAEEPCVGCVYLIISGKVKVSYQRPDDGEIVLEIRGPSEIFGATRLLEVGMQDMNVTTLTEVVAVPIKLAQLLVWMTERPEIGDQVLRLFARRVKRSTMSLVEFGFAGLRGRIASGLLLLSKQFGWREGDVVRVVHDLTLDDFALLVGVAPRTVDATLRDFADRGWIRLDNGSVVIVDGRALKSAQGQSY
jgi:CRP-like cAMP-binding protein